MDIRELQKNLETYIMYLENIKKNKKYIPTREEIDSAIYLKSHTHEKMENLLHDLSKSSTLEEKKNVANSYIKFFVLLRDNQKREALSKKYRVSPKDISLKLLSNGKTVYYFFSMKKMKSVIIEDDILCKNSEQSEYNFIPIYDIKKYSNLLNNLDKTKLNNLKLLLSKTKKFDFKYIDIINQLALDSNNNLYEITVKSHQKTVKLVQDYTFDLKKFDLSENIELTDTQEFILDEINDKNSHNRMLKTIEQEYEKYGFRYKINPRKVYKKIIAFYKHPEKMNKLSGKTGQFYHRMVQLYSLNKRKVEDYSNQLESKGIYMGGYINIFIVSLLTIITLLILGIIYRL